MQVSINYNKTFSIFEIRHDGNFNKIKNAPIMADQIIEISKKHACYKYLVDARDLVIDHSISDTYYSGHHFDDLGIKSKFKIAVLYRGNTIKVKFLELIAQKKGFRLKTFSEEEEAIKWLTGA